MLCLKPALAILSLLSLGAFSVLSAPAQADLLGATVDVTANYPTATSVYNDPGNKVVTNAIEYAAGSYPTYNSTWQVDITGNQFVLTNATGFGFPFGVATFNGFVLKVLSGPTILSASIDGSSDFSPVSVTVLNGNEVDVNYSGVSHTPDVVTSRVNIQTAPASTPEPGSIALLIGMSISGAGFLARRRRNANKVA